MKRHTYSKWHYVALACVLGSALHYCGIVSDPQSFQAVTVRQPAALQSRFRYFPAVTPQRQHVHLPIPAHEPSRSASPWIAAAVSTLLFQPFAADASTINPWSVALSDIGPQLFTASLPSYLAFLFFLSRPEVKLPRGALFGFGFLLVFVVGTIPAALYAKQCGTIVVNIDWLHGGVQSLLTVTNLLTVLGLRSGIPQAPVQPNSWLPPIANPLRAQPQDVLLITSFLAALAGFFVAMQGGLFSLEPSNALSLPTWALHVASVVEYAAAMGLVWKLSEVSGLREWQGVVYGMLPLFTAGLIVCTFHMFYNDIALNCLITLQALLTCIGNTTCAIAAWRVWRAAKQAAAVDMSKVTCELDGQGSIVLVVSDQPVPPPKAVPLKDTNMQWVTQMSITSILGAIAIKYGELALGFPFHPETGLPIALTMALLPTVATVLFFYAKSRSSSHS